MFHVLMHLPCETTLSTGLPTDTAMKPMMEKITNPANTLVTLFAIAIANASLTRRRRITWSGLHTLCELCALDVANLN